MTTARADLVDLASAIGASGYTATTVRTIGTGFTKAALAGNQELVPAAAGGTAPRVFLVYALGGQVWLSKNGDATNEPRALIVQDGCLPVVLTAGESLNVAPATLS